MEGMPLNYQQYMKNLNGKKNETLGMNTKNDRAESVITAEAH